MHPPDEPIVISNLCKVHSRQSEPASLPLMSSTVANRRSRAGSIAVILQQIKFQAISILLAAAILHRLGFNWQHAVRGDLFSLIAQEEFRYARFRFAKFIVHAVIPGIVNAFALMRSEMPRQRSVGGTRTILRIVPELNRKNSIVKQFCLLLQLILELIRGLLTVIADIVER